MNLKEYQSKSRETAIYPDAGNNIIYPTLGLVGELGETLEKIRNCAEHEEIVKEFGDILWYLSQFCSELGLDLESIYYPKEPVNYLGGYIEEAIILASKIAEIVKKVIRDNGGVSNEISQEKIAYKLSDISDCLRNVLKSYGADIEDVAQINIDKLFSRKERGVLQGSGDNR